MEYLCGPWFGFFARDQFFLFKNCDKENPYDLINMKGGKTINRLTVEFHKPFRGQEGPSSEGQEEARARFFVDVYHSREKLNCVFFYSIKNTSTVTLESTRIYNLFDFDINGLRSYNSDYAYFDDRFQAIVQHDTNVHVGFCSLEPFPATHHSGGHPYELKIDGKHPDLDDRILEGPDDFFSGLEWVLGDMQPGETRILPVILAAGESQEEFEENLQDGITKAASLFPELPGLINVPERQKKIKEEDVMKMNATLKSTAKKEEEC